MPDFRAFLPCHRVHSSRPFIVCFTPGMESRDAKALNSLGVRSDVMTQTMTAVVRSSV